MSKISLDAGAIMSILSENRYSIMETPQDSLMNQLQNEFREGHPQSKGWGNSVAQDIDLGEVHAIRNGNSMMLVADVDFKPSDEYVFVREEVMQNGNGEIFSKPGQEVYDANLDVKHESNAELALRYPDLEHEGQHILENAYKIIEHNKSSLVAEAASEVFAVLFSPDNVKRWIKQS